MDNMPSRHSLESLRLLMLRDRAARRRIVFESHFLFFHFYFSHYVKFSTAAFQKEMFSLTENPDLRTIAITAFRGSAKSTIMNLSFVLWAILGKPGKKFIAVVGQTQQQARQHLKNIKDELENNKLLRDDLGPFREEEDEWRNSSLIIGNHNAKIMAVSIDQSVRGLRHKQYRPDLMIADDIEDLQSVKTKEGRDKTYGWVKGELIPAGDIQTQVVFIGNLLHEDCLLKRLEREIKSNELQGIYCEYPLLDEHETCIWPGKYPTSGHIDIEKQRIGSEAAWQREFLLHIISDAERVIFPEWIQYYDQLPSEGDRRFLHTATGIDLAISQNDSADYTAMVSGKVYRIDGKIRTYILPNPVNERLTGPGTVDRAKLLSQAISGGRKSYLYVEDVAYQAAMVDFLKNEGLSAKGVKVYGQDKRGRLALVSHLIQSGQVLFPRLGAENLILQLTGFGKESHDDLADAFAILMLKTAELKNTGASWYLVDANAYGF
jgi:phage terminase large subunit-like protein